ncbi:MAG: L-serine ammonia-lyase, iron-sulfur-dependent, subunit alpha [Spirochaetales bacterium]|nr:L-serine ammonia-lyase, iron-sulfur-dependent, subunit alpha [Spirochaetales bacterium]
MDIKTISAITEILKEELVPAMGCTEPIAIAYASSIARSLLSSLPTSVTVYASPNIIKNVKSVVVPHTGGERGIEAAASIGIVAGREDLELEVLSKVGEKDIERSKELRRDAKFTILPSESGYIFHIRVELKNDSESSSVEIAGNHTNVILKERNGEVIYKKEYKDSVESKKTDRSVLSIKSISEYADSVDIESIRETLERQIEYNTAIANEGLHGTWGANIGSILLKSYGESVQNKAKAYAAAGSDARMNGSEKPVVINSGSGNQGLTASLPVIVYAKDLNVSHNTLLRALAVSNLVTIHLKSGIGSLSAYCGATSAGAGAGAGVCYLFGGRENEISHTVVNALAIESGMICDGAKASCAAKIASAVEAGLLGMEMQKYGSEFYGGDGIVKKGVENTINNVSRIAREGMRETDKTIIEIMTGNKCH